MARVLTWNEVTRLPKDRAVWIQYANQSLERDCLTYDEAANDVCQKRAMAIYTNASESYCRAWAVWDAMPTEEQFLAEEWKR